MQEAIYYFKIVQVTCILKTLEKPPKESTIRGIANKPIVGMNEIIKKLTNSKGSRK